MSANFDVIVIGGGITGLSTAFFLARSGKKVGLIEARKPGGLIRTERKAGFTLECGPNVILDKPALKELVDALGLGAEMRYPRYRLYRQHVWYAGRPEVVPKDPLNFIRTPLIDKDHKKTLLPRLWAGSVPRLEKADESVADYLSPLVGGHAVEHMLAPALRGVYGSPAAELSARTTFPRMTEAGEQGLRFTEYLKIRRKEGLRGRVFVLGGGLSTLAESLAARLKGELRIGEVADLSRQGDCYSVRLVDGGQLSARCLVLATSGGQSAAFLGGLSTPDLSAQLRALEYVPLTVVHLSVTTSQPVLRKSFGVLFPRSAPFQIIGVMFNSVLFSHLAPAGRYLLTAMLGGAGSGAIAEKSDEELLALVADDLQKSLGIKNPQLLNVTRWPRALPFYRVGHFKLVDNIKALERQRPGLFFAGTDLGQPGIADRVILARHTAQRVMEFLENSHESHYGN